MSRARSQWFSFLAAVSCVFALGLIAPAQLSAQGAKATAQDKAGSQDKTSQDDVKVKTAEAQATVEDKAAEETGTRFVRLVRDEDDSPSSLDTAVTTYVGKNAKGEEIHVTLLGAIHIADKAYYQELNKRFATYDALLYELVAPKDMRPGKGQESMYGVIARYLGLSDQLANIDYDKDNFVHADMSGDDFLKSMEERGESFIQMFFKAMGQAMAQQNYMQQQGKSGGPNDFQIIAALIAGDKTELKKLICPQFEDMQSSMNFLEGPNGSTIVTERNKVALDVLKEQIDGGKTNLGIFYGAGHFHDMEQRLVKDFGLKLEKQEWLKAWNMATAKDNDVEDK